MYTDGNPVNYTDPTGQCWLYEDGNVKWYSDISLQCRNTNIDLLSDRSAHPEKYNPNSPPPLITWSPSMNVNLATDLEQNVKEAQYTVRGFNRGDLGYKLCGIVSLAMILETATGLPDQLYYIWDEGLSKTKNLIGIDALIEAATRVFPKSQEWQGRTYQYNSTIFYDGVTGKSHYEQKNGPNWYGSKYGEMVYPKLSHMLLTGHYVIAGVTIKGSGWGEVVTTGGVGHWVVITGFSSMWDAGTENSKWNWVRINNPFANRVEYYPWQYFKSSMKNQGYIVGELWHNK